MAYLCRYVKGWHSKEVKRIPEPAPALVAENFQSPHASRLGSSPTSSLPGVRRAQSVRAGPPAAGRLFGAL